MNVNIKENSRETDDEIPTIDEEMLDFNDNVEITLTRHSKEHDEIKPIFHVICVISLSMFYISTIYV